MSDDHISLILVTRLLNNDDADADDATFREERHIESMQNESTCQYACAKKLFDQIDLYQSIHVFG